MSMSRVPRQLLTGWVAHPRPTECPEMNFGRPLKRTLKRNDLPTDFETWSAIARERPRQWPLTHFTPTPSPQTPYPPTPSPPTPRPPTPSPPTPNQPPVNHNAPLPGDGNLALPTQPRLGMRPSPKRNTPKRTPPTAPLGTLPAPTAPTPHRSSTIFRKASL
jgi:hypothetical protein